MATRRTLAEEVTGLDALEMPVAPRASRAARLWAGVWPKVLATVLALGLWQLVVWSGWRPDQARCFQMAGLIYQPYLYRERAEDCP